MLDIEKINSEEENKIVEKIFEKSELDKIDSERILLLVKRDFGLDDSKRDATNEEKIIQNYFIFLIHVIN